MGKWENAWFAANKTVTAKEMKVSATSSSSLVIATAADASSAGVGDRTIATFTGSAAQLVPSTHDLTVGTSTGLKYNTNPEDVSVTTGYVSSDATAASKTLAFAEAVNNSEDSLYYYTDFIVCIAASGAAMTNQDLVASLDNTLTAAAYTMNATSIDFYVQTAESSTATPIISSDTYKGTLNVAKTGIDDDGEVTLLENGTIPQNRQTTSYLQVLMRVYVDGDLKDDSKSTSDNVAYVTNDSVAIGEQNLTVNFNASTHSSN